MNNQHGQRIALGQRFSASDILQVEGRAVRHPGAGLRRSLIPSGGEERAIRAANVNLDVCRVWRIPTDRGSSIRRARDLYRSEEHTSELQSLRHLVCRLLLE